MPDLLIPVYEPIRVDAPIADPSQPSMKTAAFKEVIFHRDLNSWPPVVALACKKCKAIIYCPRKEDMAELASVHANKQHKWSDF